MDSSLLFSALLTVGAPAALPAQGADVAIVGARIEVGDGRVIPSGNVILRGDRIAAVGPDTAVPSGATVIDGKGLTVYPGFIDAYSTRGLKIPDAKPAGTPPDNRTTAPATMWHANRKGIRSEVVASQALDLKNEVEGKRTQGITTVLLTPGGGMLSGVSAVVSLAGEGKVLLPEAATEMGFRNGSGAGYPGTLFGVTATLRQTLADAQYYAKQPNPTKDPSLEGLKGVLSGKVPALFNANTAREITRADRIAGEFGMRMIVNGGTEAFRMVDLLKARKAPVILSLDVADAPTRTPQTGPDATPKEVLEERYQLWQERIGNAKTLNAAGIPIAFSGVSGFGNGYLPGVRKLILAGLPREAALRAMTSGAAQILGVGDRVGTVEAGKLANLVVMAGDFASDKSEIRTVLVEGAKFDVKKEATK
ncbi:MAG: amidohydrolase family protein [Fimbriimonas sp.]